MLKHLGDKIVRYRLASERRVRAMVSFAGVCFVALLAMALSTEWMRDAQRSPAVAQPSQIEQISAPESLRVITRVSPNTYFESDQGPNGFEYELLSQFADFIGKELEITTSNTLSDMFHRLGRGEAHLASAGLTPTTERNRKFVFTAPYLKSQPIVVYRVGNAKPRSAKDLIGKDIVVVADSTHSALLDDVRLSHPEVQWRELRNVDYTDLLGRVENGEVDYTVLDSAEFVLNRGFFPRVKKAFTIGEQQSFSWVIPRKFENAELYHAANQFLAKIKADGTLDRLEERFYGQAAHINQVAANEFSKNMKRQLPRYVEKIKDAAKTMDMDWRLLAAVSYQESRWDPLARSPTGVRGFMMLTLPTAREMGVTNRLDTDQSLQGGAKYLKNLKARLSKNIAEPDRSWFALAAYNVGFGHLGDARVITATRGGDPNSWYDVKQNLPLLTQEKWYSQTRYGYARGYEPVQFVQRIRHYYNVLMWQDIARNRPTSEESEAPLFADIFNDSDGDQIVFQRTSSDSGYTDNNIDAAITSPIENVVSAKTTLATSEDSVAIAQTETRAL